MKDSHYTAIVLAAGQGRRMNSAVPKQFLELMGKPVIYYSLQAFEESPVDDVIIVTGADMMEYVAEEIVKRYGFTKVRAIVAGGKERNNSVYNGLVEMAKQSGMLEPAGLARQTEMAKQTETAKKAGIAKQTETAKKAGIEKQAEVKADAVETSVSDHYVLIHDGARCFVDGETILRLMEEVKKYPAVVAAVPVKDTIKVVDEELKGKETPDRSMLWTVQTPQVFVASLALAAYSELESRINEGCAPKVTDDTMVIEYFRNIPAKMVMGSYFNIKVTTPEDLIYGEAILASREKSEQKSR